MRTVLPKLTTIGFILLLLPGAALAQIPTRGNVFFGYSYGSADFSSNGRTNLNGWNGSLEGKVLPWVGFVADFSGLYGTQNIPAVPAFSADTRMNTVVLGPRVSVDVGKFTPFAEALFGASHIHETATGFSDSDTSFATALGGGMDYRLIHGIGLRVQGDMLQTRFFSNTQNNFRLSTGIVLHF
ncbi:MAG TPA: outer membrane beta-barrel protein [Terriglobales bacterium]|jgi:opacity protein-like surface antigen|nr:outer membrane beta-barrel protein [Terriglobales bacterium]